MVFLVCVLWCVFRATQVGRWCSRWRQAGGRRWASFRGALGAACRTNRASTLALLPTFNGSKIKWSMTEIIRIIFRWQTEIYWIKYFPVLLRPHIHTPSTNGWLKKEKVNWQGYVNASLAGDCSPWIRVKSLILASVLCATVATTRFFNQWHLWRHILKKKSSNIRKRQNESWLLVFSCQCVPSKFYFRREAFRWTRQTHWTPSKQ